MNEKTVQKVTDFPPPINKRMLESFLGLVQWIAMYIPIPLDAKKTLNDLKKKGIVFKKNYGEKEEKAFMAESYGLI